MRLILTTAACVAGLALAACGEAQDGATSEAATTPLDAGGANAGMAPVVDASSVDAKVAGTDYDATTIMDCGFNDQPPTEACNAGVKRKWGEDGTILVEVTKPDGRKRAIFIMGLKPYGADSAQADGSAGWDFKTTREGDMTTVRFGPETYVIVDALIEGG